MSTGKMPDLGELMKQAQRMQADVAKAQAELVNTTATGNAGGGLVTATVNGQFDAVSIKIDKTVVDPADIGMLEDLVAAAFNAAVTKMREQSQEKMSSLMGGMNIPGLGL